MKENNNFRGETVDEAIENGLRKLGLTRDAVLIEILYEGRKGILGIGSKNAEVCIRKIEIIDEPNNTVEKNAHTFEPEEEIEIQIEKNDDTQQIIEKSTHTFENIVENEPNRGMIWVENGLIHCQSSGLGNPIVRVPPMILLYKNGVLASGQVTISENDDIKIEYTTDEAPTKWIIEKNKEKTEATISVTPGYKTSYKLRDQKPAHEIVLGVIESVEPNLTLTANEIHDKLKSLCIVFGILEEQIEKACKAEENSEFIIAKGESPVEGKNGWLEYKVEINEGKQLKQREDGSVDFREGRQIPSVDAGVEIAILHEPIEGKNGKAITGEVIPAKPVHPLQLRKGKGVSFKENEPNVIISTSIGRPSIEKRASIILIDVVAMFEHKGDVSLASGNLKFNGDIMISGNVEENMTISASGNIEIRGTTSKAQIKAGQSVTHYSNVISSEIIAGNGNKIIFEKTNELNEIYKELLTIQHDLLQISQNKSFSAESMKKNGIMPLVKMLIQTKYMPVVKKIRQFIIAVKHDIEMLGNDWENILKQLQSIFIMMDYKVLASFADFDHLVEEIKQLIEISSAPLESGVSIILPSAMNCNIYSSGDVFITKQGCYNSTIYAQGILEVRGFVRGGRVFAGKGANIDEVGSKSRTQTLIIVPEDQTIKIKNALADTTIQIGRKRYTFLKDMTNIVARIDEEGSIVIR